ncbi:MAG: L-threonylcarbamoyladenylate synthase [Cyclobacteriaceae bacterium]|jgi:L-threonylcarbamoyladenylate synthase|nr:L-threonylcarbamoyladenylate synthase [Cytophagales bacterium]MCZ8328326.1 L-threonylcarbamoyladenylate synthase [Cyclobacteriaceae bacterium]
MATIGTDVSLAVSYLQKDELVAIPTETVYGLAGNAFSAKAVTAIFETKNRPTFDPLIVHVANVDQIKDLVLDVSLPARKLIKAFWPGPLTILLPKSSRIPDLVTSGSALVGLRCPAHPLTRQVLQQLPFPLAAPSANPFGYISPTKPEHVEKQLGDKIPYILDGGISGIGLESTIVGFDKDQAIVYRLGGLSTDEIEKVIGKVKIELNVSSNPKAPGQLKSHYAPSKKFLIKEEKDFNLPQNKIGVLSFKNDYQFPIQKILSPSGNLAEAAANLFTYMRALDESTVDEIWTELVPDIGLGKAINDRLQRAAAEK